MRKKAVTLVELIVAMSLLGIVMLGAMAFDRLSRGLLGSTERQNAVVNDAALVTDHMSRSALLAIGDVNNPAIYTDAAPASAGGGVMTRLRQDFNRNGRWDGVVGGDRIVGYAQSGTTVVYCATNTCPAPQILANGVTVFGTVVVNPGYATVQIRTDNGAQNTIIDTGIFVPGCSIA